MSVVVIGAGPTGVTAATLLAQYGVECLVLERWSQVYPQPRAVHMDDEIFRIVARVGIADEFAAISRPALGLRLLDSSMRVLAEFCRDTTLGSNGFPQANMFDQPELETLLRRNLEQYPGVEVRGDVEVTDVIDDGHAVRVTYVDRTDGTEHVVEADYVLGCDGAHRRDTVPVGVPAVGHRDRGRLRLPRASDRALGESRSARRVGSGARHGVHLPRATRGELESGSGLPARRCRSPDSAVHRTGSWRRTARRRESGVETGRRTARHLPVQVLDTYQQERKPHAHHMIRLALGVGRLMTGGGEFGNALRRAVLPMLFRSPGLGAKIMDGKTPALHRSALVHKSLPSRRLAGSLCPNPVIDDGERLDTVLGNGFALVTTVVPSPAVRDRIERCGTVLYVAAPGTDLARWLRHGRASGALVRPDRTVLRAGSDLVVLCDALPQSVSSGKGA